MTGIGRGVPATAPQCHSFYTVLLCFLIIVIPGFCSYSRRYLAVSSKCLVFILGLSGGD